MTPNDPAWDGGEELDKYLDEQKEFALAREHDGEPLCPYCGRTASQVAAADGETAEALAEDGYASIAEWAMDDGTYNAETNHFCCNQCYIRLGMPSSPTGWQAR